MGQQAALGVLINPVSPLDMTCRLIYAMQAPCCEGIWAPICPCVDQVASGHSLRALEATQFKPHQGSQPRSACIHTYIQLGTLLVHIAEHQYNAGGLHALLHAVAAWLTEQVVACRRAMWKGWERRWLQQGRQEI